jgi:hypothetical protein
MLPLFAQRAPGRRAARAPRVQRDAALVALDRSRAATLAQLVADAERPLRLDGRSDALQRAVEVATVAGWIVRTRSGHVAGPVEIGVRRPPRPLPVAAPVDLDAIAERIAAHIEAADHPPSQREIAAALRLSYQRFREAARIGRERGLFYAQRGRPGFYLGRRESNPRDPLVAAA